MATWRTVSTKRVWGFDVEARPGPWGGDDFTFKNMLSLAGGYERGNRIEYLAPGFTAGALEDFVAPLRDSNVLVVAHNGIRYDLPFLNGTLLKMGLSALPPLRVHDTYSCLKKTGYAFSKSLANLSKRFGVTHKGHMGEYDWELVYAGDPQALDNLRTYNIGDVRTTLELRRVLVERGLLLPPKNWTP